MTSKVVSYKDLFAEFISASDLLESQLVEQLHEEIGSDLMALKLKLSASELIDDVKVDLDEKISGLLGKIKNLANQFYPSALDELGLISALRSCVRRLNHFSNVTVEFNENNTSSAGIHLDRQRQLYYIVEEVLIKVIEESNENKIMLTMTKTDEFFNISITDTQDICQTILTNENFLTDLGIQKMYSRLNKMDAQIICEMNNNEPAIKISTRNDK